MAPAGILAVLAKDAVRALPNECCGALLGDDVAEDRRMRAALPLPNAVSGGRYALTPESIREAEMVAREAGMELVGFYHSHPRGAAEPSPADLDAAWPWYTYLIVAPAGESTRAWRLAEDRSRFQEQVLVVEEP